MSFKPLFDLKMLPLFLLLPTLSTVFLLGNERHVFYRSGHHSHVSAEHLSIARNLSIRHNFLMFIHLTLDTDGAPSYAAYNRHPIGGYGLIKLAILPFDDDPATQIYAARMLMLSFFVAAAILAYLSLSRLTAGRMVAATATLLAFSSYFCLYYNDMIHPKTGMGFFSVLLVFYGMVIFVQDGRFFQLLVKVWLALSLDWHVLGLLLPFIFSGLAMAIRKHHVPPSTLSDRFAVRYVLLGVSALLLGTLILTFNFTNEYFALNGKKGLTELPSYRSLSYRLGMSPSFNARHASQLSWQPFLEEEFRRIGLLSLPYVVLNATGMLNDDGTRPLRGQGFVIVGMVISVACLIGIARSRHRMLLTTLALSGFCWSLPMRHNTAFHDYEGLFHIGIPLIFFSHVIGWMQRRLGTEVIADCVIVATLTFGLSSLYMGRVGQNAEADELSEQLMADSEIIRNLTNEKTVLIFLPRHHHYTGIRSTREWEVLAQYFLAGSTTVSYGQIKELGHVPDFVYTLGHRRIEGAALLTPENRLAFLYEWNDDFFDAYRSFGRLLVRSNFDVYVDGTVLRYVKSPCSGEDWNATFFLHVIPVDVEDLPDHNSRQYGFENRDFYFGYFLSGLPIDRTCEAAVALPEYAVAYIRTGQYIPNEGRIWEETFSLADDPPSSAGKESSPLGDHPRSAESRP